MSRFAGEVSSDLSSVTCELETAVTATAGVVNDPGGVARLVPVAVLVATVPFGVEPLGKRTLMIRSPELPAGSGLIRVKVTVPVLPAEGVVVEATSLVPTAETNTTSGGRTSVTTAFRQLPTVALHWYVSR